MHPNSDRSVVDNLLLSRSFPILKIQVHPSLHYAGGPDFILYKVARAEQHLFVDVDPDGLVRRLLWVQFEGYLPDNTHTYDYSSSAQVEIAGWPFYYDAGWNDRQANITRRPDSDGAAMAHHLEGLGYAYPDLEILERYVTLSSDRRSELMIIYAEDGALQGLALDALNTGGTAGEPWVSAQMGLHQRGFASFQILPA